MKARTMLLAAAVVLTAFAGCKKGSNTTETEEGGNINAQKEAAYNANTALADSKAQFYFIADVEGLTGVTKMNIQSTNYSNRSAPLYWCYGSKPYMEHNVTMTKTSGNNWVGKVNFCFDKTVINESGQLTAPGECKFKSGDRYVGITIYDANNSNSIYQTYNADTTSDVKPYIEITSMNGNYVTGRFEYPFWRAYKSGVIVRNGVFKIKI